MRKRWEIELPQKKENWEVEFSSPEHHLSVEVGGVVPYKLPVASPDQLGGVQPVAKTDGMTVQVGVDEEGKLWVDALKDQSLVTSVNGKTGKVVLSAEDVGALPLDTDIPSIAGLATEDYVNSAVSTKVDKVDGKSLSTNDYTNADKDKLARIAEGANKTVVDNELSSTSANPVQNKVVNTAISNLDGLIGGKKVSEQIGDAIKNKSDVGHTHIASEVGADASGSANTALINAKAYTNSELTRLVGDTAVATQITNAVSQKSQVQIITWEADD